MSKQDPSTDEQYSNYSRVSPPLGWEGKTLEEMLNESREKFEETGHYYGQDNMEFKKEKRFEYERLYSELRGALVGARETALHISASPIVRELGELCFQVYTPEGDSVAVSTGIIVHVHTGSLAIKYMIEEDYEHDRAIEPGDIFCYNDNDLGNVHTADVHTIVPIFHEGELVAWVDGTNHQVDIGGATPGHDQVASTSRYEDGLYATCLKVGEDDDLYQDWKEDSQRAVRTPQYFDLDEKCRLAGCHMIREQINDMIEEVGPETFKKFMREAVEEGRRTLHQRVQERLFPGTYRESSFMPVPFEGEAYTPKADKDMLNHLPVEMEVDAEGHISLDMEGASPPGPHPYNAAEGAMEGGLWVSLTQCLLHDGKVNDGSHLALDAHFPEGSVVNPQDPSLSYNTSWGSIMPTFNGVWKCLSRGFFSRGFREEVVTGYAETADVPQGEGELLDTFQAALPESMPDRYNVATLEPNAQGLGASAVRDGLDHAYAMWNPETDMDDAEDWELLQLGLQYLGRRMNRNTAGHGKYRGGSGWEVLTTIMGSKEASLYKHIAPGVAFTTSGMSGGYPGGLSYSARVHDTDLASRIRNEEPYPVDDRPPGNLEEMVDAEETVREQRALYWPKEFDNYDLFQYNFRGGPGYGDPLERPIENVKEDIEDGIYTTDIVESVYGVVGEFDENIRTFEIDEDATEKRREEIRQERRDECKPVSEFWEEERQRIKERDVSDPVADMYKGVFGISDEWGEFYREFWDLTGGFEY